MPGSAAHKGDLDNLTARGRFPPRSNTLSIQRLVLWIMEEYCRTSEIQVSMLGGMEAVKPLGKVVGRELGDMPWNYGELKGITNHECILLKTVVLFGLFSFSSRFNNDIDH